METINSNIKELIEDLRREWKIMWRSRIEDEIRAEGIADKSYKRLFIDRGLILYATRKFRPPDFHEILEMHLTPEEMERFNPNPVRGGVKKFIREYITSKSKVGTNRKDEVRTELENMKKSQQQKHGGRGWLHLRMAGF